MGYSVQHLYAMYILDSNAALLSADTDVDFVSLQSDTLVAARADGDATSSI